MRHKKNITFLLIVLGLLALCIMLYNKKESGALPFSGTSIDAYVGDVMQALHVPGLALAIIQGDDVVYMKGYGVLEEGKEEKVNTETIFQFGSCSKAFTAASLGILVDEGKITWEDKVIKYLPQFKTYDECITKELTIADLLSHRSGIEDIGLVYFKSPLSRDELIHQIRYFVPIVGFREHWVYNNLMYLAAGQIIPVVTGMSWDEFVTQRFLVPLGMSNSGTTIRGLENKPNIAQAHVWAKDKIQPMPLLNLDSVGPAGSMHATITDMTHWVQLLLNKGVYNGQRLLSEKTMAAMHSAYSIVSSEYPFYLYGLGWGMSDYHGHKFIAHRGSLDGFTAMVGLVPDKKLGIIILTNLHKSDARAVIMNHILDHYLEVPSPKDWLQEEVAKEQKAAQAFAENNKKMDTERKLGTKPSLDLTQYTGVYHNDLCGKMFVEKQGDHLFGKFLALQGAFEHWDNDTFVFDSSIDYPTVEDRFLIKFDVNKNKVQQARIKISSKEESVFKKIE